MKMKLGDIIRITLLPWLAVLIIASLRGNAVGAELCYSEKPNCAYADGWPAYCVDEQVEREAFLAVKKKCRRCKPSEIRETIAAIQVTRGPFVCAQEIAKRAMLRIVPSRKKVRR